MTSNFQDEAMLHLPSAAASAGCLFLIHSTFVLVHFCEDEGGSLQQQAH